ncbi:hypothetical protein ACFO3O_00870 [Dokdonia ponticola]|uniref:Uncharacterized protein n=1 Tax=Dokdonia ponticola TaxID=2041041 RepID=A0ABV9HQH3_9FLAO
MSINEYLQATKYESLIKNAFNCQKGNRNGADKSYMQNAMTMERGETYAKHLGSFDNQFEKVKNYISKALNKLSSTKHYSTKSDFFNELNTKLEYCNTTKDLMEIVELSLDKVIELKNN